MPERAAHAADALVAARRKQRSRRMAVLGFSIGGLLLAAAMAQLLL